MAGREDPAVARLLDRFVAVRLVQAWGLDLDVFLSDPRLSFACVFLNAEGAVYARFHAREPADLAPFAKVLEGVLELHAAWPSNRAALEGKKAAGLPWKRTSDVPDLKERFGPAGVRGIGCLQCHEVRDGVVRSLEKEGRAVPARLSTPYPVPERIGLSLKPGEQASVVEVQKGGAAEAAGVKGGDILRRLGGQPLLSIADVEWALYVAPDEGALTLDVERAGRLLSLPLRFAQGWRTP